MEKTDGGEQKGKISLYCRALEITRQGFYQYLARQGRPWKYQGLAEAMRAICEEDLCNDTYGRRRMRQALPRQRPLREYVGQDEDRALLRPPQPGACDR